MTTVNFSIPGPPIGKGRPRFAGSGRPPVTPKKTREYEKQIGYCGLAARPSGWDPARWYALTIDIHFPHFTRAYQQPDDDNVLKAIKDGLEGVLWKNDKRVKGSVRDIYLESENPRVDVTVALYEPKREARGWIRTTKNS